MTAAEPTWTAVQIFSKRAPRLQREAEDIGCGTFCPTYAKVRYIDGKRSSNERQLMPGYLFVKLRPDDRGRITDLEGVYRILPGAERALARLDAELVGVQMDHVSGAWNEVADAPAGPRVRYSRRRRRPRPGKRLRARAQGAAA